jgi:hypothetical protein
MTKLANDLGAQLEATARRLGMSLETNGEAWRTYAAERMLHLSTLLDQPGYAEAVVTEATNVALQAAGGAVDSADALDREIIGTIAGGLVVGARALAGGVG